MKFLFSPLAMVRGRRDQEHNASILLRFGVALIILTVVYMVVFKMLMSWEGREQTWVTSFYWVLTVMSTLGFGDVTFTTDAGRLFSMLVLATGMVLLLVLLPFLFIELFYIPWSDRQKAARTPSEVPKTLQGHVILTEVDSTIPPLRRKLERHGIEHLLIHPDLHEALRFHDDGWSVMVGDLDLTETYVRAGIDRAALVAATGSDAKNAHVAFTVRETGCKVPIVAIANDTDSVDVLEMAGCTEVIHLAERMGEALSRRVSSTNAVSHPVGSFDDLLIAEATVRESPWVGMTLQDADIRRQTGASVVGIWEQGRFKPPLPTTELTERGVLLLAGDRSQLDLYDATLSAYGNHDAPVVIIGGGRVGRATARALDERGIDYRVIEKDPDRVRDGKTILGSGADREILESAGFGRASTVVVTTHDDDVNVFLVLYCRRLRSEVQILSRASRGRNVETLHRAGADFVLSYSTMGANAIFNHLQHSETVTVAEGLYLFRLKTPEPLFGKSLMDAQIRPKTGATVVAIENGEGRTINPDPKEPLPSGSHLILIGGSDVDSTFLDVFRA